MQTLLNLNQPGFPRFVSASIIFHILVGVFGFYLIAGQSKKVFFSPVFTEVEIITSTKPKAQKLKAPKAETKKPRPAKKAPAKTKSKVKKSPPKQKAVKKTPPKPPKPPQPVEAVKPAPPPPPPKVETPSADEWTVQVSPPQAAMLRKPLDPTAIALRKSEPRPETPRAKPLKPERTVPKVVTPPLKAPSRKTPVQPYKAAPEKPEPLKTRPVKPVLESPKEPVVKKIVKPVKAVPVISEEEKVSISEALSRIESIVEEKDESQLINDRIEAMARAKEIEEEKTAKQVGRLRDALTAEAAEAEVFSLVSEGVSKELFDLEYKAYYGKIRQKTQSLWVYTGKDTGKGIAVVVAIKINKDGNLLDYWIEQRSGNNMFDDSALRAIQKAAPYPALPQELDKETLEIGIRFCQGGCPKKK